MPIVTICFVALLVYFLGESSLALPIQWGILILMFYCFAPLGVYFSRKVDGTGRIGLEIVDPNDSALPLPLRKRYRELQQEMSEAGFVEVGCLKGYTWPKISFVAIFQNRSTSDIAQLILFGQTEILDRVISECLEFTRERVNGSKIITLKNTRRSISPSSPKDSVIRIIGKPNFADLWKLHSQRVAADSEVINNDIISDALAYQMELEKNGAKKRLESGYWQLCDDGKMMRPTLKGAYAMSFRILPIFAQYQNWRDNRAVGAA